MAIVALCVSIIAVSLAGFSLARRSMSASSTSSEPAERANLSAPSISLNFPDEITVHLDFVPAVGVEKAPVIDIEATTSSDFNEYEREKELIEAGKMRVEE